jgi:uncharacterized LabA/DUF88 family protein
MEKLGIEIKTKDLQIFYGGAKKADWDVGMAVDAIKMAHKVDAVVLATGDGDFIPAVEYIKSLGCQVEAITFGRSSSSGLRAVLDDFIDLEDDPKRFLIGFRPTKKKSDQKMRGNRNQKSSGDKAMVVGSDTDGLLD